MSIVAGLLLLAGCSNDDAILEQGVTNGAVKTFSSFTATLGDAADTRTYLGYGSAEDSRRVFWNEYDEINVFTDENSDFQSYWALEVDGNTAKFTGEELSGNEFYALYPLWGWEQSEDNPMKVYFTLGEAGNATSPNGFRFNPPMVAKSTDNNLQFKQTTGLLHVTIGGVYELRYVSIEGNNGEKMGHRGFIDLSEENPVFRLEEGDPEGEETGKGEWLGMTLDQGESGEIYFVLPPMTFEKGFTMRVEYCDEEGEYHNYSVTTSEKLVVERATVTHFDFLNVEESKARREAKTRAALKAFYDALGGDNWENNDNWNTDAPLNEWYGLEVWNGALEGIFMSDNNLVGAIPAEIADLTDLWTLELSHNSITSFPENITMPNIRTVFLAYNQLSGPLPESFAYMPNLENLHLDNNQYEGGIPDSYFTNLTNLRELFLYDNMLAGTITRQQQASPMWQNIQNDKWVITSQQEGYGLVIEGAVTEIQLNRHEIMLAVGESLQLNVTILPEDADNKDVEWGIDWMSSDDYENDPVFTVDENGLVTAIREGEGTIWVRALDNNGADAYCYVRVSYVNGESTSEGFTNENKDWDN